MAAWAATRIESLNTSERRDQSCVDNFRQEESTAWAVLGSRPTSRGRVDPKVAAAKPRRRLPSQHLVTTVTVQARAIRVFRPSPSGPSVPASRANKGWKRGVLRLSYMLLVTNSPKSPQPDTIAEEAEPTK